MKHTAMDSTESGILGMQLTLVGLFLVVFFEGVSPYPLVGLLLGIAGTAVVFGGLFARG
jgi:hypothetical protein